MWGDRTMATQALLGGRYRLESKLEDGGMGSVWHARDLRLHREVAVKMLHPNLSHDDVCRDRFRTEARAIAAMRHTGIINIFDYGEESGDDGGHVAYLVMELVDGRPLADLLQQNGPMPADVVAGIIADTASALDVAHGAGIIHRDIKPSNILIDTATGVPKIIDFGIARAGAGMGLTAVGMVMGTASYVAPEQLRGGDPSAASDVYSLGVVAYECLAGFRPFDDEDTWRIIEGHLNDDPPPLPASVPDALADTVMRALDKDPKTRWSNAREFGAACQGLGAARTRPPTRRRGGPPSDGDEGPSGTTLTARVFGQRRVGQRRRSSSTTGLWRLVG